MNFKIPYEYADFKDLSGALEYVKQLNDLLKKRMTKPKLFSNLLAVRMKI